MRKLVRGICSLLSLIAVSVVDVAETSPAAEPWEGLIAHWSLDGHALDAGPNGLNGTVLGAVPSTDHLSNVDGAFSFNGSTWISVPDNGLLTLGSQPFTISVWMQYSQLPGSGGYYMMGHDEGPGTTNKWIFWVGTNFVQFFVHTPATGVYLPVSFMGWQPAVGDWHHLAVRRDGQVFSLFVDGTNVAQGTDSRALPNPNAPLFIGNAEGGHPERVFRGSLDDVRIFQRALTDGELAVLANQCRPVSQGYGILLFRPSCTLSNSLPQPTFSSRSMALAMHAGDVTYLSSSGEQFSPVAVDQALRINGVESGLGPYTLRAGVPPYRINVPIEDNLVPLPAPDVSALLPQGSTDVLFELLDQNGSIHGNTAVYLVADCGIWLSGKGPTALNFVTHDDQIGGFPPEFDVRFGLLSQLRADRDFTRSSCLGHFLNTPGTDALPNPAVGDGNYYLARGSSSCVAQGYGDSSISPDPRDALNASPTCP